MNNVYYKGDYSIAGEGSTFSIRIPARLPGSDPYTPG
jgi:hypothetical protein